MYRVSSKYLSDYCPLKLHIIRHLKNNIKNIINSEKNPENLNHGTGYNFHVQS